MTAPPANQRDVVDTLQAIEQELLLTINLFRLLLRSDSGLNLATKAIVRERLENLERLCLPVGD